MTPTPRRAQVHPGAWVALAGAAATALAPLPLDPVQQRLAAIFVAIVVLWVTEALPIAATALLVGPLLVAFDVAAPRAAFAPYADPLLFLFVGGFFIARAMTLHGLDRRIARGVVSLPGIRGVPGRTRGALMFGGVGLSMWISNTATTAILAPITLGIFGGNPALASRSLLAVAYACSLGGLGTLVGSPPNLITVRFLQEAGVHLDFVDWMIVGLPMALAGTLLTLMVVGRAGASGDGALAPAEDAAPPGPWSRGERVTALAFGLAVVGWVVPGVLGAIGAPGADEVEGALPVGGVALLAASVLFAVPDTPSEDGARRPVLPWAEANRIDWGIIMLFGGGISLGTQMFETGLAARLARGFVDTTGVTDPWLLTAVVIVFTILFTEVCSNTASANMLAPLVIAVAETLGVSPVPPTLAVGLAASCAFMLPIATGPNAIAYGTGQVPLSTMLRTGAVLNAACAVTIFGLLRVLCPLLGWA